MKQLPAILGIPVITSSNVKWHTPINQRDIKTYLRNKYGYFLKKDCILNCYECYDVDAKPSTNPIQIHFLIVTDIKWGRKISAKEQAL